MAVESIIIFKEGENIAVSLHNKGIEEFVKQIKTADEIIYMDNNISRVATLELVKYKNGGSHVVKESQNLLSSAGQKSLPFDWKYDKDEILPIDELIIKEKIQLGRLEIAKGN